HRVVPLLRREVVVVEAPGLLEAGRVRVPGDRKEHRVQMAHVVAADDAGAVGEAAGVPVARGAEEERGRVDGPARDGDDAGRVRLPGAVPLDVNLRHLASRRARLEARAVRVGYPRDGRVRGG